MMTGFSDYSDIVSENQSCERKHTRSIQPFIGKDGGSGGPSEWRLAGDCFLDLERS